jgi:hypothetical protein
MVHSLADDLNHGRSFYLGYPATVPHGRIKWTSVPGI